MGDWVLPPLSEWQLTWTIQPHPRCFRKLDHSSVYKSGVRTPLKVGALGFILFPVDNKKQNYREGNLSAFKSMEGPFSQKGVGGPKLHSMFWMESQRKRPGKPGEGSEASHLPLGTRRHRPGVNKGPARWRTAWEQWHQPHTFRAVPIPLKLLHSPLSLSSQVRDYSQGCVR